MGPAKKKNDPISDRSRALNDQIAALETEIKKLDASFSARPLPNFVPPPFRTARPSSARTNRPPLRCHRCRSRFLKW
jgi:hypothetical protein